MRVDSCRHQLVLAFAFLVSCPAWPQGAQENRTLEVNGRDGKAPVVQVDGRTYIDLESLVRIGNGTLSFEGQRISLSLPAPPTQVATPGVDPESMESSLSREFMKAAIEEVSLMREWASPLANAIQNGYPVTDSWVAPYRTKAQSGLHMVSASVANGADRNAMQLVANLFEAVERWSANLIEARNTMSAANYAISSDALQNDPLSQKLVACGHFLDSMLASGHFQDDPSCH
jgi:hypothetical protein